MIYIIRLNSNNVKYSANYHELNLIKLFITGKYKTSNEKAVLNAVTKSFDIKITSPSSKKGTFAYCYISEGKSILN